MTLEILVAMKVVPKPEEVKVNLETMTLERAKARSEINPSDMAALEHALALKERHGARVTVLSMGPPFAGRFLNVALAMGCDEAVLLSDRAFAGADTLATSYALAKAIETMGIPDLVLCGEESSDGATGQVPPGIAEWLDIEQVTCVSSVDLDPAARRLIGHRELRTARETVRVPLPAVVSVLTGSAEPRFMDFERKALVEANDGVRILSAADIKADPQRIGGPGSPTIVTGVKPLGTRQRRRVRIEGSPEEKAAKVWQLVKGVLSGGPC